MTIRLKGGPELLRLLDELPKNLERNVNQITTASVTLELTTNSAGVGVVEVLAP